MTEQKKIDSIIGALGEAAANYKPTGTIQIGESRKAAELAEDQAQLESDAEEEPAAQTETQWYINPNHFISDLKIS